MDKSIALPTLHEIAKNNSNSEIRAKAVYQIGNNSSSKQSIEILKNIALEDSNSKVQEKAVYALYDMD